jgi:hypothetical protein
MLNILAQILILYMLEIIINNENKVFNEYNENIFLLEKQNDR